MSISYYKHLKRLFNDQYNTSKLNGVSLSAFTSTLNSFLVKKDFHWGHDHDFGNGLFVDGSMTDRHFYLIGEFITYHQMPISFRDKKVLDIGPCTGGTSLIMTMLGADVTSVEKDATYCQIIDFLRESFDARIKVVNMDIIKYLENCKESFDYVLYSGSIYLVQDPLFSLRKINDILTRKGKLFIVSHNLPDIVAGEPHCIYGGSYLSSLPEGKDVRIKNSNCHFFVPSKTCLITWCLDTGFENVTTSVINGNLCLGCSKINVPT